MRKFALISLALLAFVPAMMANPTSEVTVTLGNSWTANWWDDGHMPSDGYVDGAIDLVVFRVTSATGSIESVPVTGSPGSWTSYVSADGKTASLSSNAGTFAAGGVGGFNLNLGVTFIDPQTSDVRLEYGYFHGDTFRGGVWINPGSPNAGNYYRTDWWGLVTNWNADKADFLAPASVPVPVPGAALLGVIGLGIVGWVKRRFA